MSEVELLIAILSLAKRHHWQRLVTRPRLAPDGSRAPLMADSAGFPDLLLCRGDRIVCAELKSRTSRMSPEQLHWLAVLADAGCETHVWRPADWRNGHVLAALQAPGGGSVS